MQISIDRRWCKGCHICVSRCKKGVFDIGIQRSDAGYLMPFVKAPEKCIGCRLCERFCPDLCINVHGQPLKKKEEV